MFVEREESWRSFHRRHSSSDYRNRYNGSNGGIIYSGGNGLDTSISSPIRTDSRRQLHQHQRKKSSSLFGCLSALTGIFRKQSSNSSPSHEQQPWSLYNDSVGDLGYNF